MSTISSVNVTLDTLRKLRIDEQQTVEGIRDLKADLATKRAILDDIRTRKRSLIASLNVLLSSDSNEYVED